MADIQPETVYVTAPSPGVEATSDTPISNNLTPFADAASGGGLALSPSPGTPGSITPGNPQPARPPKETVAQGIQRGAHGTTYMVDGQGNLVESRATAPSGKGEFGSVLGGIVMGALAGLTASRPGRIPSTELGGGAGAGAAAAVQAGQQRDLRNRGVAQQNFANQQAVQKMSREQAESAAVIGHLAAQTASEVDANKRANDEHPLIMKSKELGMQESAVNIQKGYQDLANGSLLMMQTLTDAGISPTAMPTSWTDAQAHIKDITSGRSLPLFNGEAGSDSGVGMFDVRQLRTTPLLKPATFKTYTADRDGNPIEKINTLQAGTSALDYVSAAMAGKSQLKQILSQQSVKQAAELHKATIKEKNAQAFKAGAEGKKAEAEAAQTANLNPKGSEGLSGDAYLKTLPEPQQSLITSIAEGRNTKANIQNRKGELTPLGLAVMQAYPDFDVQKAAKYGDTLKEYQSTKNGTAGGSLNAGATALKHLARLKQINDENSLEVHIHGTAPNREYNNLLDTVADELGTFYGEPKTNEAIESKKATLGGLTNRNAAIVEQAKAMSAKLQSLQQSWDNASPRESFKPPMPYIDNDARTALQKLAPDFVRDNPQFAPKQQNGGQPQPQQQRQQRANPVTGTAPSQGAGPSNDPFAQFGGRARQ
jgi:hypothetical protein